MVLFIRMCVLPGFASRVHNPIASFERPLTGGAMVRAAAVHGIFCHLRSSFYKIYVIIRGIVN